MRYYAGLSWYPNVFRKTSCFSSWAGSGLVPGSFTHNSRSQISVCLLQQGTNVQKQRRVGTRRCVWCWASCCLPHKSLLAATQAGGGWCWKIRTRDQFSMWKRASRYFTRAMLSFSPYPTAEQQGLSWLLSIPHSLITNPIIEKLSLGGLYGGDDIIKKGTVLFP